MTGLASSLVVIVLFGASSVRGTFIQPEPQLRDLSLWASAHEDQACSSNCYSSFQNISCKDSRVCKEDHCNGRVGLPAVEYPLSDWSLERNSDGCSVKGKDTNSSPPTVFATDAENRMLVVNGSSNSLGPCYSQRNSSVDNAFTLIFWVMADCRNCSVLSLLEGNAALQVRVIGDQICIGTDCQQQQNIAKQWVMIGVRLVKDLLTVVIADKPLKMENNTNVVNIYIGSEDVAPITDIFRLYQVRYYRDALTNREIEFLRLGVPDPAINFEDCQCPTNYFEEAGDNNCTDGQSYIPRYIPVIFYNTSVTVDGDPNTYWASSDQGNVTLTLHFSVSFQIETIRVSFESTLPYQMSYSLFSEGQQKSSGDFICANTTCTRNMSLLDETSVLTDLDKQTADTIKIELHRQTPQEVYNFVITAIEITGRCDCRGNADTCTLNPENKTYTCSCKPETHSLGQHCQTCSPNYFRSSDHFACPNSCLCNMDGVANGSNPCDEIGGTCTCKTNVEGQKCDTCKTFFFHFGASPTEGCEACNCNQNGSVSCSENGNCICKANTNPPSCDQCEQYSYGFSSPEGCQRCNCSDAGTFGKNKSCDEYTGQCSCKTNVQGQSCDVCKPGFYYLETANQQGCKPCDCHPVGAEDGQCDRVTGQCRCRGGVLINKNCTPEIKSVDPIYGPNVGGTLVTITGNLLGNNTQSLAVFINDTQQDLISVSDIMVVFKTASYGTFTQLAAPIKLSWKEDNKSFITQAAFSYRGNPVIDSTRAQNVTTFVSGGCQLKIYGTDLQSVKYPKLEVTHSSNPRNRTVNCRHTRDYVICPTPDLNGLYTSANDRFLMTAVFDGVTSSEIGNIDVKPDPEMHSVGTIDFQYPFEDTITVRGTGLRAACQEHELQVFTGSISCTITHATDTEIECAPAVSPPAGYKHLPIQVIVGNIQRQVGTLHYLDLHETTGFIIIISCIAAAIGVAIIVIIICLIWRRRKKKKAASPLITAIDDASKAFSELTKPAEEPVIQVHSQDVPVLKETVFREPKKGIVNTEAEDAVFSDEFLPKVNADLREDLAQCHIGAGHFVLGRHCALKGKHSQLIDGSLQKSRTPAVKLTIKSLIHPITGSQLPVWANMALSECLRLRHCTHTHVLSILGVGINKDQFHILYPRMSQYILKSLICDASKEFSIRQLLSFGQQVAEGVTFLASKDITHKDIAARNCMVDEFSAVKLCDAAFSWDYYENEYVYDEQRERYLPIRWMAPESIKDGYYDMRTDVWSFAVFVWELLTRGCLPYHDATSSQEVSNYVTQGYILGKPDILSDRIYDLLCNCWAEENEQRPDISTVSRTLSDILETEDDGTYANVGEVAAHSMQNSKRNSVQLRQSPGGDRGKTYSTSKLSKV